MKIIKDYRKLSYFLKILRHTSNISKYFIIDILEDPKYASGINYSTFGVS